MSFGNMPKKCHYDVLGVSKTASQEEIKAAFRKLSLATHPDVVDKNTTKDDGGEAFKSISEAHTILSNANERRRYDYQLREAAMWKRSSPNDFAYSEDMRRRTAGRYGRQPNGMHVAMETLSNPRYIFYGALAFGSMIALSSFLGSVSSSRQAMTSSYHTETVEAWKNPKTGKWEQPAPWDPEYRRLKPKLESVPRNMVKRRNV